MPFTPPPLDSIESEPSGFKPPPLTSEEKPNGFKPPPIEAIEQPDMFTGRSLRAAPGYANKGKRLPGGTRVPAVVPIEEQYGPEPEKEFSFEKYLGDEMFSPENVQKMFNKQHSTYTYIPGQTLGTGKPESPVETPTGQAQLVSGVASNVGATLDFFKSPVGITSTLLGASVPAWVIRLVGGAIVANALRKTPQFVVSVGDELAKPPENRDVKKLSSEGAGLVTDFLFGGTMGFRPGMARDIPKLNEVLTKSITEEYPPQVLRDMVRRVDIQDAEIKAAQDSGRPIDSTVPTATQEERDIITFIENELGGKSAKGEISKHGAVITSSEPRIESEFWRKYLGLEPSTKTATVIGGPNAIDKIFVNQGVPSERPRTLPRQLIEGVGEEAQPGADTRNRISGEAGVGSQPVAPVEEAKPAAITAPQPDWRVVVQPQQGDVPGFVQIIDPTASEQSQSPTVESLRAAGHVVPDFTKLPAGSYTWAEAVKKLPPSLTPALLVNGKPIPGGPHHKDIVDALVKADDPRAADAVVAADSDKNHVFVDEQGNVLDRKKAAVKFDQMRGNKPGTTALLHSEDLTPAVPIPLSESKPAEPVAAQLQAKEPWRAFEQNGIYEIGRTRVERVPVFEDGKLIGYDNVPKYLEVTRRIVKETPHFVWTSHGEQWDKRTFEKYKKSEKTIVPGEPQAPPTPAPAKAVTAKDIGYKTEKAFKRDFEKNSLKQYNETEPEFMTRRHCLESVPKRKGVLSE